MIIFELPAIEGLIPHRGPMRLVDRVIAVDDESIVAAATVPTAGPFMTATADSPGYLVIEMMAQSVNAWHGWTCRRNGEEPRIGYLLGVRSFRCARPTLQPGTLLRIKAQAIFRDREIGRFSCAAWDEPGEQSTAEDGVAPFAQADITVFSPAASPPVEAGS